MTVQLAVDVLKVEGLTTPGQIPFIGAGGLLSQNTAKGPFWDDTNFELRVGASAGTYNVDSQGDGRFVARTQAGHTKARLGVWGVGYQNWLAFDFARGVIAAPTPVQNNDTFGSIVAVGYAGAGPTWFHGAEIKMIATENWDGTHAGAGVRIYGVPKASTTQGVAAAFGMAGGSGLDTELGGRLLMAGYTILTGVAAGEIALPNALALRGEFAGTSYPLIKMAAGIVELGGGYAGSTPVAVRGVASGGLAAASGANNGILELDTTNNRFTWHTNAGRYYVAGTSF